MPAMSRRWACNVHRVINVCYFPRLWTTGVGHLRDLPYFDPARWLYVQGSEEAKYLLVGRKYPEHDHLHAYTTVKRAAQPDTDLRVIKSSDRVCLPESGHFMLLPAPENLTLS